MKHFTQLVLLRNEEGESRWNFAKETACGLIVGKLPITNQKIMVECPKCKKLCKALNSWVEKEE